jgi:hypothetical protein
MAIIDKPGLFFHWDISKIHSLDSCILAGVETA